MRVLHVIPSVAPRYGGPSRAVVEMCRALPARGIEPLIATTNADGAGHLPVELGKSLAYKGVPVVFFSRQWSEAFKYSHPLARWVGGHVPGFDVVHIHAVFSHACLAAAKACHRHNVPYVVRPLGTLDPWSLRQKHLRKRLLWHVGVRSILQRATAIHYTTSEEQRLAEESLGLGRGVVIPLGVEEELLRVPSGTESLRCHYPSLENHPYVLVLCRLHPKKGLETFLEVFLTVTHEEEFRHWRLVIAGEGETGYVASLKHLVRAQEGQDRVLFPGWLEGTAKAAALHEAALLALPSHQENFGLSVVEALACGVPVLLSTQVNLAGEVEAAEAGWRVPLERAALLETLVRVLRDDHERVRRGHAGRQLVHRRFLWSAVAVELAALYNAIVQSNFTR
jgi:glycosyltransferase involved in cell wall biosynthesis